MQFRLSPPERGCVLLQILFKLFSTQSKGWEKREIENQVVGWHHRLNGCEFEQTLGDGEGQGSLQDWHAAVHGVAKSQTRRSDYWEAYGSTRCPDFPGPPPELFPFCLYTPLV